MSSLEELMRAYIAEFRAGGDADPRIYLSRASPEERRELAALIDAYLAQAPRQPFDAAAFRGSHAERTVDVLERSLAGRAGLWPTLLPRLRAQAGLKRSELVERLAAALGVADRREKVGGYYHEMEQGLLPPAGVSDRVLAALGALVGETAAALREAGEALGTSGGFAGGMAAPGAPMPAAAAAPPPAFARRTRGESPPPDAAPAPKPAWDEVDELFRGGH